MLEAHKPERKFVVNVAWRALLADLGVNEEDLLRRAGLPLDLFSQRNPSISTSECYNLWHALAELYDDPAFPLRIAQSITVDVFSPPLFAFVCSSNLNTAARRLAQYKPLVGPLVLTVSTQSHATTIDIDGLPAAPQPPPSFIAMELVFLVHVTRLALREQIKPTAVHTTLDLAALNQYEQYFACPVSRGDGNRLAFSPEDARKPFLTANESMWSVFEPELRQRLASLDGNASMRERVRACLIETLPTGQSAIGDIARRLALSERTLQRRLQEEQTSFQDELAAIRNELANHYLKRSDYPIAEIAFLLGYDDTHSFARAFQGWNGCPPRSLRAQDH